MATHAKKDRSSYILGAWVGCEIGTALYGTLAWLSFNAIIGLAVMFAWAVDSFAAWNRARREARKMRAVAKAWRDYHREIEKKYNSRVAFYTAWPKTNGHDYRWEMVKQHMDGVA